MTEIQYTESGAELEHPDLKELNDKQTEQTPENKPTQKAEAIKPPSIPDIKSYGAFASFYQKFLIDWNVFHQRIKAVEGTLRGIVSAPIFQEAANIYNMIEEKRQRIIKIEKCIKELQREIDKLNGKVVESPSLSQKEIDERLNDIK